MILILFAALALGVCGDGSRLGTTAALHDGCRDASMSLVQSQASRRGTVAAFLQLGPKPWEERYYYVGAHHKSGTELLRAVMRHAFDTLHAPSSCHYWKPGVKPTPAHFITSTDHDAYCFLVAQSGTLPSPLFWCSGSLYKGTNPPKTEVPMATGLLRFRPAGHSHTI